MLSSKVKIAILRIICHNPEKKFSGREIARLLNLSSSRCLEVLELLHKNGVVNRGRIGKTSQWGLNKESIVVNEVSNLMNMEKRIYKELKSRIYETLIKEKSILKVIIYGAVARKKEKQKVTLMFLF